VDYPERIDPDASEPGIVAIHLKRYDFAAALCERRRVLDAACGIGYGSARLGDVAATVLGVDIDEASIATARERYGRPNVSFERMDVTDLALPDRAFDVVCSFETIEHVQDPERAIAEAARVLAPDGVYVASTPWVATTTHAPANPFHLVELAPSEFATLLRGRFASVDLLGQSRLESQRHRLLRRLDVLGLRRRSALLRRIGSRFSGSRPTELVTTEDLAFGALDAGGADTVLAVCHAPHPSA
jgi:SAM-dependent methyltransferase